MKRNFRIAQGLIEYLLIFGVAAIIGTIFLSPTAMNSSTGIVNASVQRQNVAVPVSAPPIIANQNIPVVTPPIAPAITQPAAPPLAQAITASAPPCPCPAAPACTYGSTQSGTQSISGTNCSTTTCPSYTCNPPPPCPCPAAPTTCAYGSTQSGTQSISGAGCSTATCPAYSCNSAPSCTCPGIPVCAGGWTVAGIITSSTPAPCTPISCANFVCNAAPTTAPPPTVPPSGGGTPPNCNCPQQPNSRICLSNNIVVPKASATCTTTPCGAEAYVCEPYDTKTRPCDCPSPPACTGAIVISGTKSIAATATCTANTCPNYTCAPATPANNLVSDCAINNLMFLSSNEKYFRDWLYEQMLMYKHDLAIIDYDPRLATVKQRITDFAVKRNAEILAGSAKLGWEDDHLIKIATEGWGWIEAEWSLSAIKSSPYPACVSVCYDSSITPAMVDQIEMDPGHVSDDVYCKVYWYRNLPTTPTGDPNRYNLEWDTMQTVSIEGAQRGISDPYRVILDGKEYVFVQDKNNDGKIEGTSEILGSSDTKQTLFQELVDLDNNNDGYLSSDELKGNQVRLLQLGDDGKLTSTEIPFDTLKGINLSSLTANKNDGNYTGSFGSFEVELANGATAQGKETFDIMSVLENMLDGIKDFFFGIAENISNIFK